MRSQMMADPDCGMKAQTAVLLKALSTIEVELHDRVFLRTLPYCNCREMGFTLTLFGSGVEQENVCFFEHRNSDALCAIRWKGTLPASGAVTADDIPDSVYPDKWSVTKSWKHLDLAGAIEYARGVVSEFSLKCQQAEYAERRKQRA